MLLAEIETPRLTLKGLRPSDISFIFENHGKPEIMRILGHQSDEEYTIEEQKWKSGYAAYNRTFLLFLMEERDSGIIVGRCGIHNWNMDHRRAELGYNMTREDRKRMGYMTEAVEAIIGYAFRELNLNRLEALVGPQNVPSMRIIQRNGFTHEGVLRNHWPTPEGFGDSWIFSLLREEYFAARG